MDDSVCSHENIKFALQQVLEDKGGVCSSACFHENIKLPLQQVLDGKKWITVYAFHINIEFVMTQVKVNEWRQWNPFANIEFALTQV